MGILVFHFIARLYIAILYIVDLTYKWIEENTGALFFFSPLSLSFSLIFSHFLGNQTPSEDDNSEDERLKPLSP